jgi:hypothetical protein
VPGDHVLRLTETVSGLTPPVGTSLKHYSRRRQHATTVFAQIFTMLSARPDVKAAVSATLRCSSRHAIHPTLTMNHRQVHFADNYSPSSLSLRLKLGPKDKPTMVLKISIHFENGKLPRIRVQTKKPEDTTLRRRRRSREKAQDEFRNDGERGTRTPMDRLQRDAEMVRKRHLGGKRSRFF